MVQIYVNLDVCLQINIVKNNQLRNLKVCMYLGMYVYSVMSSPLLIIGMNSMKMGASFSHSIDHASNIF